MTAYYCLFRAALQQNWIIIFLFITVKLLWNNLYINKEDFGEDIDGKRLTGMIFMRHFFCKFDGGLLQLLFILFQGLFDGFSFLFFVFI